MNITEIKMQLIGLVNEPFNPPKVTLTKLKKAIEKIISNIKDSIFI